MSRFLTGYTRIQDARTKAVTIVLQKITAMAPTLLGWEDGVPCSKLCSMIGKQSNEWGLVSIVKGGYREKQFTTEPASYLQRDSRTHWNESPEAATRQHVLDLGNGIIRLDETCRFSVNNASWFLRLATLQPGEKKKDAIPKANTSKNRKYQVTNFSKMIITIIEKQVHFYGEQCLDLQVHTAPLIFIWFTFFATKQVLFPSYWLHSFVLNFVLK